VPIYSPDDEEYRNRVHTNGRLPQQIFPPDELLYRRFLPGSIVNGVLAAVGFKFEDHSGHSFNRSSFSIPTDVLEPDCCDGEHLVECKVLDVPVSAIPTEIGLSDDVIYKFRMKHVPSPCCYAHSELWCNKTGDVDQSYECPPKSIRTRLRALISQYFLRNSKNLSI
jgi:hypothetical protein